jgi:hypothetical protein
VAEELDGAAARSRWLSAAIDSAVITSSLACGHPVDVVLGDPAVVRDERVMLVAEPQMAMAEPSHPFATRHMAVDHPVAGDDDRQTAEALGRLNRPAQEVGQLLGEVRRSERQHHWMVTFEAGIRVTFEAGIRGTSGHQNNCARNHFVM